MGTTARVRWGRIGLGAFFAEAAVLAVFFLVLGIAQLAGVRELAAPMTPLDYAEALVFSFVSVFVFTLWVARPLDSGFVTHGVLVALVATLLFLLLWATTAGAIAQQPILYWVAHALKFAGGIAGGLAAARRHRRKALHATGHASSRAA
jgi:hypothetical protein